LPSVGTAGSVVVAAGGGGGSVGAAVVLGSCTGVLRAGVLGGASALTQDEVVRRPVAVAVFERIGETDL